MTGVIRLFGHAAALAPFLPTIPWIICSGRKGARPMPKTIDRALDNRRTGLLIALIPQAVGLVFLGAEASLDLVGIELEEVLGTRNLLEITVVVALAVGVFITLREMLALRARQKALEDQLRAASGAFHEILEQHFADWRLTPAEQDVALMTIKGLSIAEIAALRNTAEGTVKAQSAGIYRKAGVSGRPQLLSLFIDELMGDGILNGPAT